MSKPETVEIPLDEQFMPHFLDKVETAFQERHEHQLKRVIRAILFAPHRNSREDHPFFDVELKTSHSQLIIVIKGIPQDKLYFGKLIKHKEKQIISGVRDLLFVRLTRPRDHSSESITQYIFHFVKNSGVLSLEDQRKTPLGRLMIQGGHQIPDHESDHHKRLGFVLGLLGMEIVTGSGGGSMEDPFKGAILGYHMNQHHRKFIGITKDDILPKEPSNDYVDHLIIFPDIEKRLEAFIRMTRGGIILPGGVGTLEEILTILWVKTHPLNRDLSFPLYLCQPVQSGNYFRDILEFLELCFEKDFIAEKQVKFFLSEGKDKDDPYLDPKRVAWNIHNDMEEARKKNLAFAEKNHYIHMPLWNWEMHFPREMQKPLKITKEFMESLDFSRSKNKSELFYSLRALCSAMVEINILDRDFLDESGPFRLRGDKDILKGIDELFNTFVKEGRIGRESYLCPYVIS